MLNITVLQTLLLMISVKYFIITKSQSKNHNRHFSRKKKKSQYKPYDLKKNKRAQRALGRSPEEKVNGHRGANNREPQGHNMNYGRGPFDDVIY